MNTSFGKQLKMKFCERFLFFLLMIMDVSTNAQAAEVTCEAEQLISVDILMGHPGTAPPYKPGHILVFRCTDVNLKMYGQRTIECLSNGKWNYPYPRCEEITCTLLSTTFGIRKIKPEGKTIFRVGESVEIICDEKFLFIFLKQKSKTYTCQENGQWDHQPICQEIRCEVPRDQHVEDPEYYFRGDKKLGTKQYYYCQDGYDKMAEVATCTEDGWTPNPLCAKMCTAPYIPNAEIVEGKTRTSKYQLSSKIKYQCDNGFEPEYPVQITCNSWAEWTGIQPCTGKICPPPPYVENGDYNIRRRDGQVITEVHYTCQAYYVLNERKIYKCENGKWETPPKCLKPCEITDDIFEAHNIDPREKKGYLEHGHSREVYCKQSYTFGWRRSLLKCSDGKLDVAPCQKLK